MSSTFIQGGTVVDGTGASAYTANVRIEDGFIAAIGVDALAQAGDEVIDAAVVMLPPVSLKRTPTLTRTCGGNRTWTLCLDTV